MKTWDDYKKYVKSVDNSAGKSIDEIEEQALIISAVIKKRTELGLSQRELAQLCGVPQSSVARIESHAVTPKLDMLIKIMRPLGLKLTVQK